MQAVILKEKHNVYVGEFPEPPMDDNSVKIAVAYCGLCGTDLHKYEGKSGSRPLKLPVPLGHEISGVVVQVGEAVKDFSPGDRVTVDPNWSCGRCHYCRSGLSHLCKNSRGVVKGMADFVCPPQENVYHIPDKLSLRDACLTEPLSCCLHGMDLLDVKLGQTVVIVGMGSIGAIMVQLCRLASAGEIIVIEPVAEKRSMAFALGATRFLDPTACDPTEEIEKMGIANVDRVMECVGLPATIQSALHVAGMGARVVLFGVSDPAVPTPIDTYSAMTKELAILPSFVNPHTTSRAIILLSSGVLDTNTLISKELTPEEIVQELKERTYSRQGKVIVKWREMT